MQGYGGGDEVQMMRSHFRNHPVEVCVCVFLPQ
jgi:hypothetical protein